jgi:hypothetical protein
VREVVADGDRELHEAGENAIAIPRELVDRLELGGARADTLALFMGRI